MAREEGLAEQFASDTSAITGIYDDWATGYDSDLDAWGYQAPTVATRLLANLVQPDARVLDAGCGTGLVGAALVEAGFTDLAGIDVSTASLELARATGSYGVLGVEDLASPPTGLADHAFAAVICVGVMTYLADVEATCREFCRITAPGAAIVLTQRSDLFVSRNTAAAFAAVEADGLWSVLDVTEPRPYLPGHGEYADEIGVHYACFRRT